MHYQVIIMGSGFTGASLALALSPYLSAAVIEKSALPSGWQRPQTNARALALSHPSILCLDKIGVWSKLRSEAEAIKSVHVSSEDQFGRTRLSAEEFKLEALGYILQADRLNEVLNQSLSLPVYRPATLESLMFEDSQWRLKLKTGEELTATLLVAADGSDSELRQRLGVSTQETDHHQVAMICSVSLKSSHRGQAYERFLKQETLAFLPLGNNEMKCVWVMDSSQAKHFQTHSSATLLDHLQHRMGYRLGKFVAIGKQDYLPLKSSRAETVYAERAVFVGNAANTLHPVGAQGLNLGLRDVASLAEILIASHQQKKDIGSMAVLKKYAASREEDHFFTRTFTSALINFRKLPPFCILGCELLDPLKHWVGTRGLGTQHHLPKLCRGEAL